MNDHQAIINAYLDDELTESQHRELMAWIRSDSEHRKRFVAECYLHSHLQDIFLGEEMANEFDACDSGDASMCSLAESFAIHRAAGPDSPTLPRSVLLHGSMGCFASGWPAAYLVAAVICGVGLTIGALVYVSPPVPVASGSSKAARDLAVLDSSGSVARITGLVDCVWDEKGLGIRDWGLAEGARDEGRGAGSGQWPVSSGQNASNRQPLATSHYPLSTVSLGDSLALKSGLLEITYHTGARVILQGPVVYKVNSDNGGFLARGTLTGRVLTPESRGLAIRTPTAAVVDLGTEFGVFVADDQSSTVRVFNGSVEITPLGAAAGRDPSRRLGAGEAARLTANGQVQPLAADWHDVAFVRTLASSAAAGRLRRGLAAYWAFDDAAHLGKNATGGGDLDPVNSPEYEAAGLLGGALRLHGVARRDMLVYNGGRRVPKGVPIGSSSYSISLWFRTNSIRNGGACTGLIGWGSWDRGQANVLVLREEDGRPNITAYWVDYDMTAVVRDKSLEGGWHHLVATYNERTGLRRLFLDGRWLTSRALTDRPNVGPSNFAIGRGCLVPDSLPQFFDGLLDEIGVWSRELSETEVADLYHHGQGVNPLTGHASSENAERPSAPSPDKKGASPTVPP